MPDIIHQLPDSVANQIAAGEVIQRPASVVKELLENAVDSGADDIKLVIRNAGKTLVQVIDNGCGMSETDARMCFERHATSKIKEATDLFAIKTLGFRGEALASIAAIAQVELKSKRVEDDTGTMINVQATKVSGQASCACSDGTSVSVKNLFYNIPARRKFLKSDTTELRHIIEEFQRVALVRPGIRFSFFNEERPLYQLSSGNLKQRIVAIFGSNYNTRLIPVALESEVVNITGFIGKPEYSRKTRGEQYFFVNGRFIRHPYLNHAVDAAFKELIPNDAYPTYFIYFEVNPDEIDVNIHPTKTEINFQNNQVTYAMLSASIKQALGKFNISPSLDFEAGSGPTFINPGKNRDLNPPKIAVNPQYNPFVMPAQKREAGQSGHGSLKPGSWEPLYETAPLKPPLISGNENADGIDTFQMKEMDTNAGAVFQISEDLIVASVKSGLMVIHRRRAWERILFEEFIGSLQSGKGLSQQSLFPLTLQFPANDAAILIEINDDLRLLGFDIEEFGDNTFILNGTPADLNNTDMKDVLDYIIEDFKKNLKNKHVDTKVALAKSMAVNMAGRQKGSLGEKEVNTLIDRLFATKIPDTSPDGKPVVRIIAREEIENKF